MKTFTVITRLLLLTVRLSTYCNAAVIDVKSSATLNGGLVRLGDVAVIDDADPELLRQLQAVSLGPAPAPGRKLRLTQQTIRERLLAHGVNLSEVEFAGQSVILIESGVESRIKADPKAASKPVAVRPLALSTSQQAKAEKVVQTAFHRHYRTSASDIGPLKLSLEIREEDVPDLLAVDPEQIHFLEPGLEWGGPQELTAQYPMSDGTTHIVRLTAWLNETPHIVKVKHSVTKGKVIQESDLVHVPAKEGEKGFANAEELIGQEASRTLSAGAAPQPGDVSKIAWVRANDLVTVKVKLPGLTVSRVFKAVSSGADGEIVNLVSLEDSRDKVQARVTGWHEAVIVTPTNNSGPSAAPGQPSQPRRVFPAAPESTSRLGAP